MPTATPRELREYQQEAVDAVLNTWGSDILRTAVVLPTGTGKSTVIASVAAASYRLGLRVIMLAHRAELLDQMAATVAEVDPDAPPVGIVRADTDESDAPIVAASLQTLTNPKRHARVGERQVVLFDETHHVVAASYRKVVEGFGTPFFAGFTATLRREDGKALRELIDTVAYEKTLRWAIDKGYLVKPTGLTVKIPDLDLDRVRTTAGDFQQSELAEVMEAETDEIVAAIARHAWNRRGIIFAASVDAAHGIADALTESHAIAAEAVTGAMSYEERQPIYDRFRAGKTQMLVTVQVLTEGADFPMCDAVVIARPTQSINLYSQMVGRGLRPYVTRDPDTEEQVEKADCLVLDLVGVARVLKLVTLSKLDAGTTSKIVDTNGIELPPDDFDDIDLEEPASGRGRSIRQGPIDTVGIDLLGDAHTAVNWLGTHKRVPFIQPQGEDWAVFLWEDRVAQDEDPLYKVGIMTTRGPKTGGWLDDGKAWSLAAAKEIAEDYLFERGCEPPSRHASWRRTQPPSQAQIGFAQMLGVENPEQYTKAALSDQISIAIVSPRLDGAR